MFCNHARTILRVCVCAFLSIFYIEYHLQRETVLLLPFQSERVSLPFLGLFVPAKTSTTTLNRSSESGHPCLIPSLRGKVISLSSLFYQSFITCKGGHFTLYTSLLLLFYWMFLSERKMCAVKHFFWIYWGDH